MRVLHIGLACVTEGETDRFYRDVLGLVKQEHKMIPASIVKPLFNMDAPIPAVNYVGDNLHVEVFFTGGPVELSSRLSHVCLEVGNMDALVERAISFGMPVVRIPKGEGWVVFIDDSDGHRFEIKQQA